MRSSRLPLLGIALVLACGCGKKEYDFSREESTKVDTHLPIPPEPVEEAEIRSLGTVRLSSWGGTLCQEARWGGSGYTPLSFRVRIEVSTEPGREPSDIEIDRLTVIDEQGTALWTFDPRYDVRDEQVQLEWEELEPGVFQFAILEGRVRQVVGGSVVARGEASYWHWEKKVAAVVRVYWGGEYVLLRSEYLDEFNTYG
jgi:hypothetical protein